MEREQFQGLLTKGHAIYPHELQWVHESLHLADVNDAVDMEVWDLALDDDMPALMSASESEGELDYQLINPPDWFCLRSRPM
jgi:hypothetical protein